MDSEKELRGKPNTESGKRFGRQGQGLAPSIRGRCNCHECRQDRSFAEMFSIARRSGAKRGPNCTADKEWL